MKQNVVSLAIMACGILLLQGEALSALPGGSHSIHLHAGEVKLENELSRLVAFVFDPVNSTVVTFLITISDISKLLPSLIIVQQDTDHKVTG